MYEIESWCSKCGSKESHFISNQTRVVIKCKRCGIHLLQASYFSGYVYLLSNPALPSLIKIGSTEREVPERVNELNSSTAIPLPFEIEAYWKSRKHKKHETETHRFFSQKRVPKKEFFKITVDEAIPEISRVIECEPVYLRFGSTRATGLDIGHATGHGWRQVKCRSCNHIWTIAASKPDGDCPKCSSKWTDRIKNR